MKYLLFTLLLIFSSFSVKASNVPEAGSVCGDAYGYEVCVWSVFGAGGFDDEYGLRSSYRLGDGGWVFLTEQTNFIANMTTAEITDGYFQNFVDGINDAIDSKLKPISVEPTNGVERIKWLVQNFLTIENNQLVFSSP